MSRFPISRVLRGQPAAPSGVARGDLASEWGSGIGIAPGKACDPARRMLPPDVRRPEFDYTCNVRAGSASLRIPVAALTRADYAS
jgi:hypothetical protein